MPVPAQLPSQQDLLLLLLLGRGDELCFPNGPRRTPAPKLPWHLLHLPLVLPVQGFIKATGRALPASHPPSPTQPRLTSQALPCRRPILPVAALLAGLLLPDSWCGVQGPTGATECTWGYTARRRCSTCRGGGAMNLNTHNASKPYVNWPACGVL